MHIIHLCVYTFTVSRERQKKWKKKMLYELARAHNMIMNRHGIMRRDKISCMSHNSTCYGSIFFFPPWFLARNGCGVAKLLIFKGRVMAAVTLIGRVGRGSFGEGRPLRRHTPAHDEFGREGRERKRQRRAVAFESGGNSVREMNLLF